MDGPIRAGHPPLSFDELADLRDLTRQILEEADTSVANYRDEVSGGFFHVLDESTPEHRNAPGDYSKSSTATVVRFLVRTGRWTREEDQQQELLNRVIVDKPWRSALLPKDNPFTVAFLLELIGDLIDTGSELTRDQAEICAAKLAALKLAVENGNDPDDPYVRVEPKEATNAYLTQLALRVLLRWERTGPTSGVHSPSLETKDKRRIRGRAIGAIHEEIARASGDPSTLDVFELGYSTLIAQRLSAELDEPMGPTTRRLAQHALRIFFDAQREDGSWPLSRRLFNYPDYGSAYCYEYEFLVELLEALPKSTLLWPFLTNLRRAVDRLIYQSIALPGGGFGWPSEHHRQLRYPESWSTASCFHACHLIDRLAADAVTDHIFEWLEEPRPVRAQERSRQKLDAILTSPHGTGSVKELITTAFVAPIESQLDALESGRPLKEGTLLSAILYGPPGTSKTRYAEAIARALGWELISVDPSHLLRRGLEDIQTQMNELVRRLSYAERVVVLFDEIDELVRSRTPEDEALSRFLTTSTLPKIIRLRKSRQLVFIIATNHLEVFDPAIARPGRFDLVVPILPPSLEAKLEHWPEAADTYRGLQVSDDQVDEEMSLLTYDEYAAISGELAAATNKDELTRTVHAAFERCTMNEAAQDDKTWRALMEEQEPKMRPAAT